VTPSPHAAAALAVLLSLLIGLPLPALASPEERIRQLEEALRAQRRTVAEQRRALEEQREVLRQQSRLLDEQESKLDALRREIGGEDPAVTAQYTPPDDGSPEPTPGDVPTPRPPQPRAPTPLEEPPAPVAPAPDPGDAAAASTDTPSDAEPPEVIAEDDSFETRRPESQRPIEQLLVEAGGILLPAGALQVEPSFEYTHISDSAVAVAGLQIFNAILIGTVSVDRLERDVFTTGVTARYGLFKRFQLETRLPFVIRQDQEVIGVGTPEQFERTVENYNLGDFEVGALWQPVLARGWVPNLVFNMRARFPTGEHPFEIPQKRFTDEDTGEVVVRLERPATGSGFYGLAPGFTSVWRTDPVVLFFGGSYGVNFKRDFGSPFGTIDPGDQLNFFAGLNVSLSERVALNLSYTDTQTFDSKQNGRTTPGSSFHDSRLVLGSSINTGAHSSLLVAVAAGLTEQSPDVQVILRVPLTWRLPALNSEGLFSWIN